MQITFRKAKKEDYKQILLLYGDFVNDPKRFKRLGNDAYHKVLKSKNTFLETAVLKSKIVGFVSYSLRDVVRYPHPILEIEELYVTSNMRKNGIGRKLMERVLGIAKKKKCHYVFLASSKDRTAAHHFYQSLGFDEYAYHYRRKI